MPVRQGLELESGTTSTASLHSLAWIAVQERMPFSWLIRHLKGDSLAVASVKSWGHGVWNNMRCFTVRISAKSPLREPNRPPKCPSVTDHPSADDKSHISSALITMLNIPLVGEKLSAYLLGHLLIDKGVIDASVFFSLSTMLSWGGESGSGLGRDMKICGKWTELDVF